MAYSAANLSIGTQLIGGKFRVWYYRSTDAFTTVDDTDYFALAGLTTGGAPGLMEGDWVVCIKTDDDPPTSTLAYCSAIDSDGNGTVAAVAYAGAASFTTLATTGNSVLGDAAADLVGFHGTSASQRASSVQATTNIASSSDFGATQLAVVQEIMNTLTGKGAWKGSA